MSESWGEKRIQIQENKWNIFDNSEKVFAIMLIYATMSKLLERTQILLFISMSDTMVYIYLKKAKWILSFILWDFQDSRKPSGETGLEQSGEFLETLLSLNTLSYYSIQPNDICFPQDKKIFNLKESTQLPRINSTPVKYYLCFLLY